MRFLLPIAGLLTLAGSGLAQQTIRVEIDYMEDQFHSHRPAQAELDAVVRMFAAHNTTLVVEIDDNVGHFNLMSCDDPGRENFWSCNSTNSFTSVANTFRDKGAGWHYCLFIHRYDDGDGIDSSGKANSSNFFVVSLGGGADQIGTPWDRAGTFAHELGHNLGLGAPIQDQLAGEHEGEEPGPGPQCGRLRTPRVTRAVAT